MPTVKPKAWKQWSESAFKAEVLSLYRAECITKWKQLADWLDEVEINFEPHTHTAPEPHAVAVVQLDAHLTSEILPEYTEAVVASGVARFGPDDGGGAQVQAVEAPDYKKMVAEAAEHLSHMATAYRAVQDVALAFKAADFEGFRLIPVPDSRDQCFQAQVQLAGQWLTLPPIDVKEQSWTAATADYVRLHLASKRAQLLAQAEAVCKGAMEG